MLCIQADLKAKKLKKDIQKNQKDIGLRLVKETERDNKILAKIKKDLDYEKAFRDGQARSVIEARTSTYIAKVTSKSVDIIDPTGRSDPIAIQPSQITV